MARPFLLILANIEKKMEGEDWGEPESRIISVRSCLPYLKRVHITNDRWLALVLFFGKSLLRPRFFHHQGKKSEDDFFQGS